MSSNEAFIVAFGRSPIARAGREKDGIFIPGALSSVRPDDLAARVLELTLRTVPTLTFEQPTDVVWGTAFPEAEQGFNLGRLLVPLAGLPFSVTGHTVNRWCASGLQAIVTGFESVSSPYSAAQIAICGGVESMSRLPMGGFSFAANPRLTQPGGDFYLSMGLTAEAVAKEFGISRADQDQCAFQSHRRAIAARDLERPHIFPMRFEETVVVDGVLQKRSISLTEDDGPRADTSLESLAKLKPAFLFDGTGTVTAGNSSQVSDGAACAIVVSHRVLEECGVKPLARLVSYATAGVEPSLMGIGPIEAFRRALKMAGLSTRDIGLVGLNEAFAAQWLAVGRALDLDPAIVNVNGGAIAIGHPLGATGARDFGDQCWEAIRRGVRYFAVGMCVGGGQGMVAIFENVCPGSILSGEIPPTP